MIPSVGMPFREEPAAETALLTALADEREATRRQAQLAFDILLSIVLDSPGSAKLDLQRLHDEFWASAGTALREYRTCLVRRYETSRDTCGNG
jgi:hypothetical protein